MLSEQQKSETGELGNAAPHLIATPGSYKEFRIATNSEGSSSCFTTCSFFYLIEKENFRSYHIN
ncbi:hypothetical protein Hanom_Chr08g00705221 [Helianthus anomalus]